VRASKKPFGGKKRPSENQLRQFQTAFPV